MSNLYPTTDLPLGTTDVKALYNNASNLDEFSVGTDPTFTDRKLKIRKTIAGMENDFTQFLIGSGYIFTVPLDYAAGIVISLPNQIFLRSGEYYRAGPSLTLPYITTGVWGTEGPNFVSVGDAALRSQLTDTLNPANGAALVARATVSVASVADLAGQPQKDDIRLEVKGYHAASAVGGGTFVWASSVAKALHNGGTIISPTVPWNGALTALPAFLVGTGETAPAGSGCWVRVYEKIGVSMFGAVSGTPANAATANDAAINAAMNAASLMTLGYDSVEVNIEPNMVYLVGGTFNGTNKSIFEPKSFVRVTGTGTIKVQDGANSAAGATGWNLFYPRELTDAPVHSFEVIGVTFDGNGINNANTIMKGNCIVGILSGTKFVVNQCKFLNCPGWNVITAGKNAFPQEVNTVHLTHNEVFNVAESIPGNTGITDHSSFYMMATDGHADNNRFITSVGSEVSSCIEIHGSASTANDNFFSGFLNLVNIAGVLTSVNEVTVAGNVGSFSQMVARAFTSASFFLDNIVIRDNQMTIGTTGMAQVDFGGPQVANRLIGRVTIQDNVFNFAGVDTLFPPPAIWLRGVAKAVVKGNSIIENFGWSVLVNDSPTGAVISITDNVFDTPNRTGTVSFAAAVYVDAPTFPFKLVDVSRNTIRNPRQYALQASAGSTGDVVKFMNNTVTEASGLVNVPSSCTIGRVDVLHYGDVPTVGQFSDGFTKFSMGSQIIDSANNQKWTMKKLPSGGVMNLEAYGTAAPVAGQHYQGDIVWINAPAPAGFIGVVCTADGVPGTWKTFGGISA